MSDAEGGKDGGVLCGGDVCEEEAGDDLCRGLGRGMVSGEAGCARGGGAGVVGGVDGCEGAERGREGGPVLGLHDERGTEERGFLECGCGCGGEMHERCTGDTRYKSEKRDARRERSERGNGEIGDGGRD